MRPASQINDPTDVLNWRRIDERITTSGQPTTDQLAAIAAIGVSHIVNLGLHSHERALADEPGDVARLGMTYSHLPVDFGCPTETDFAAFRARLESTEPAMVHVHCIFNWRVSAFFYKYRRDVLGLDEKQARMEMETVWQPDAVWTAFLERRDERT